MVLAITRRAYAKYAERMDRLPRPVYNDYEAELTAEQIWVIGEPVVGVIVLVPKPDSLLVENVVVDPQAQAKGLGRRLMEFAEECAISVGLSRLTLYTHEVMTENQAIYRHLGFGETDRRAEDGYHRVFMAKDL